MKNLLIPTFFISVFLITNSSFSQTEDELIGSWQASEVVASGYNDTYTFNENRTFIFIFNQMDCAKRDVSFEGFWNLLNNEIELTLTAKTILVGGYYQVSGGSCASDSMLIGAELIKVNIEPAEKNILNISDFSKNLIEGMPKYKALFNNRKFWHFPKFEY